MDVAFGLDMLSVALFLPTLLAGLVFVLRGLARLLPEPLAPPGRFWLGLGALLALLPLAHVVGVLWARFDPERLGAQAMVRVPWLPELGLHYFVGLDGISLLLVTLVTALVPVALVASQREVEGNEAGFVICVLVMETGLIGSFVSLSWLQMHFFFELSLMPLFFVIGIWGRGERIEAATRMLISGFLGSLLLLVAMVVVNRLHFEQTGVHTLDLLPFGGQEGGDGGLLATRLPVAGPGVATVASQSGVLLLLALGSALKTPVFPLHAWLLRAHASAPVGAAILLLGAVQTLGVYVLLRIALPLSPVAVRAFAPELMALLAIGALYAALLALVQSELRRLLAYASIAQMAFVSIGVLSLGALGMTGAVVLLLAHGLGMTALLALVGWIAERRRTTRIEELGGLVRPMPVFAALLALAVFSVVGLPALPGFVGELLVLLGAFRADRIVGLMLCLATVLLAAFMFDMYRRVALGPVHTAENRGLIDLSWRERSVVLVLLVPMLVIGLHPNPVLRRVEPAVLEVLRQMDDNTVLPPAEEEPEPEPEPERELI